EVTVGQFKAFVKELDYKTSAEASTGALRFSQPGPPPSMTLNRDTNWRNPGFTQADDHPVVCVSLNDAVAFCDWLSKKDARPYTLVTEAQWEYCCRAGTQTAFSFGDETLFLGRHAWYSDNATPTTHPVGKKLPNPWGLFDMHGNAAELTIDWLGNYREGPQQDPKGELVGSFRGGGWFSRATSCRSAWRWTKSVDHPSANIGFRVALVGDLKAKLPIAAVPDAADQVLPALAGAWNGEFTQRIYGGKPAVKKLHAISVNDWIAGKKWLRQRVYMEDGGYLSLAPFDPKAQTFRDWFSHASGLIFGPSAGRWDPATRSITWTSLPQNGILMLNTWRFVDADTVHWEAMIRDKAGETMFQMDARLRR